MCHEPNIMPTPHIPASWLGLEPGTLGGGGYVSEWTQPQPFIREESHPVMMPVTCWAVTSEFSKSTNTVLSEMTPAPIFRLMVRTTEGFSNCPFQRLISSLTIGVFTTDCADERHCLQHSRQQCVDPREKFQVVSL